MSSAIDISKYRLLTPAEATLNIEEEDITIFMRGEEAEVIEVPAGDTREVNLFEIRGIQSKDFNLTFHNHTEADVKQFQEQEDWLQALYFLLNFTIGKWVECRQHNLVTFFNALYADDDQPEPESSSIVF